MRRRTLAVGAVVLGGAALLLFCCGGSVEKAREPGNAPAGAASLDGAPVASAVPNPAFADAAVAPPNPTSAASAEATAALVSGSGTPSAPPAPSASGAGSRIATAVQTNDPRDLELLSRIERELQRDPPPEVHALIAARRRGASRDELATSIRGFSDLRVRVLAFRWLDTVAPAADAGVH